MPLNVGSFVIFSGMSWAEQYAPLDGTLPTILCRPLPTAESNQKRFSVLLDTIYLFD